MLQQFPAISRNLGLPLFLLLAIVGPELLYAAQAVPPAETTAPNWGWNLLINLLVLAIAGGSAMLPVSALRQWTGQWRLCAALPLIILLIWVGIIVISKQISAEAHQLWPMEIFAWAMVTMIYMVTLMTAKRAFEKKDLENS